MKVTKIVVVLTAILLAAPVAAFAESLDAKPGAWELTYTSTLSGGSPPADAKMSPDKLAKLPPAARAQVEQAMKALAGKPQTRVSKSCITQKDLDQDRMIKSEDEHAECTRKVITKTARHLEMEKSCTDGMSLKLNVEATTPETVVATMDMTEASRPETYHADIKGRWLGASCEGIKHIDSDSQ